MILSAAIVDKDGSIYVARQYCEMTRSKVEAIYMGFARLITKDKHSNILEDIKTLRLFVGAINEYASLGKGLITEDSITHSRFDLLFVFDEIVVLGVRQIENLSQLRTVMEMKSEEEKAFVESLTRKEKEAKAKSAEKAKELDQQRRNEMLHQQERYHSSSNASRSSTVTASESKPAVTALETDFKPSMPIKSRGRALKLKAKN